MRRVPVDEGVGLLPPPRPQGDVHKLHRSVGMKGLNSASVRARMDEVVHERATQLVERWQGADPATLAAGFQAFREAQRFTVDGERLA